MKSRSEAFNKFKVFENATEVERGKKVGLLHTDRGSEFMSKKFNKFYEDHGIQRHLIQLQKLSLCNKIELLKGKIA